MKKVIKDAGSGQFTSKKKAAENPGGTYVQTVGEDYEKIAAAVDDVLAGALDTINSRVQGILDGVPYQVVLLLEKRKRAEKRKAKQ